jgi:hypothetical protein
MTTEPTLYSPPVRGLREGQETVLRALMFILAPAYSSQAASWRWRTSAPAASAPVAAVTLDSEEQMFLDLVNAWERPGLPRWPSTRNSGRLAVDERGHGCERLLQPLRLAGTGPISTDGRV